MVSLTTFKDDLQRHDFDDSTNAQKLFNLKLTARNPDSATAIYNKDGLSILAECAFGSKAESRPRSSLEAAKIIANALLLRDSMQQVFADLGFINALVDFYRRLDAEHEFVGGRILFLLTYKSKTDFVGLIESHGLVDYINRHVEKHISGSGAEESSEDPMSTMALTETLKLLYNLASKRPAQMHFFSSTVNNVMAALRSVGMPKQPLDPPIAQLLNVLAIVDWPTSKEGNPSGHLATLTKRLIQLLDNSVLLLTPGQLETMLIPLLTVLRKVHEVSDTRSNELLVLNLLPQDEERDRPLGKSQTLASRLLQLQTSGGLTNLPDAISGLLFDLSDHDATKFVHNIGYGHAAGYLMTHKIPIPDDLKTSVNGNAQSTERGQINPITGQRTDAERPVRMPEMTEEEKEREAERLFVLFERLKATGVMSAENPLRTAQQSGRFEELSDSEPD